MGSEEEKSRRVRAITAGDEKLCAATNMLGLGLDAPSVQAVIHLQMPFQLHEFVQESGRAGRTGLRSECYVLREY